MNPERQLRAFLGMLSAARRSVNSAFWDGVTAGSGMFALIYMVVQDVMGRDGYIAWVKARWLEPGIETALVLGVLSFYIATAWVRNRERVHYFDVPYPLPEEPDAPED